MRCMRRHYYNFISSLGCRIIVARLRCLPHTRAVRGVKYSVGTKQLVERLITAVTWRDTRWRLSYDAAVIMTCVGDTTAAATASIAVARITHSRSPRRTSIKSVCRASMMNISRLPDTGLIGGHIISEETSRRPPEASIETSNAKNTGFSSRCL